MPADQPDCAQRLRGASLQLVTVLLRALHVASLPALPVAADTAASAAANASAAAAGLPLPPLRLPPPLASLLGDVERGDLCRRATDAGAGAGAGAGAMELSVGAVFAWVLRLWEDELRRGLTVSELRVRQLADVGLRAQRGPGLDPASRRGAALLPLVSYRLHDARDAAPLSAGYHPYLPSLVIAPLLATRRCTSPASSASRCIALARRATSPPPRAACCVTTQSSSRRMLTAATPVARRHGAVLVAALLPRLRGYIPSNGVAWVFGCRPESAWPRQ